MITQKSLNIGWGNLTCSVQDCQNRPGIALQVFRRLRIGVRMELEEGVIPATAEYIEKGLHILSQFILLVLKMKE